MPFCRFPHQTLAFSMLRSMLEQANHLNNISPTGRGFSGALQN
jgi:hypothetical protein